MEPFSDFYYNDSYETQVKTGCRKRGERGRCRAEERKVCW